MHCLVLKKNILLNLEKVGTDITAICFLSNFGIFHVMHLSTRVGSSEVIVVRYCSKLQF